MMFRMACITLCITVALPGISAAQEMVLPSVLSPASRELLATAEPRITFDQVDRQGRRDSRLNGFLIGFVAGAVPGIMLGMGINTYCNNESSSGCPAAIPIVGGLLGLAGGGIGYAIDDALPRQALTFGRQRPSPGMRFSFTF